MTLLIIFSLIVIIVFVLTYRMKYDTIVAFTGGLGSGKTFLTVKTALKLYKKNLRKTKIYNLLHKKHKRELPKLYSNVPILIKVSKKGRSVNYEYSVRLLTDHLLLRSHINERSVVVIDEVGSFCSQFDFNNANIRDNFDEFVRLFRHYTKGGYLVVNDQCSENIVLQIRRRINTVFNLCMFRVHLPYICKLFWSVKVRNISISEEIKTIEENDKEDNMTIMIGFMPLKRHYDTYCYSERYSSVPYYDALYHCKFKTNKLLSCPKVKLHPLTTSHDEPPAVSNSNGVTPTD